MADGDLRGGPGTAPCAGGGVHARTNARRFALALARTMERPSEVLQALISLERVHRQDPALEPDSYSAQISELAADQVAGWVRKRAEAVLAE